MRISQDQVVTARRRRAQVVDYGRQTQHVLRLFHLTRVFVPALRLLRARRGREGSVHQERRETATAAAAPPAISARANPTAGTLSLIYRLNVVY